MERRLAPRLEEEDGAAECEVDLRGTRRGREKNLWLPTLRRSPWWQGKSALRMSRETGAS